MPTTYFYKNKFFLLINIFIFSVNVVLADKNESHSEQLIRVGVFPNPPIAFKNEDGQWSGISIDVLQAIANKRGWKLNFIEGSFSELLKKAEKNQVDIFSMMAFSEARAKTYSFSRNPLISNWGLVYTRTDAKIASLLDLEGKRVGVMKNNIHDSAFRELTKKFNLNLTVVELANFRDVMENIQKRNIDAGVVNRLFGALNASKYNLVETGIIFNPINIHYSALNPDNRALLDIIDQQLIEFKSDKNSVYFTSLRRWLNNAENSQSYLWLIWLATGLFSVIIVMSGLT
ncbi:MAG: transporter substrate-binding domain-containing protein, partial [Gammaproteobacteria bacterium]|nr:transporter substrate-binding domain-containing protein [Gammaproteobacteria bacterium]